MIDYKGIEALNTVIEMQSFEMAAQKLHITQSAISQRIKAIEMHHGEPVLVRTLPYRPTALGKQLIGHFKKVCLLEEDLQRELSPTRALPRLSIAMNRDSLETWFLQWASEAKIVREIVLEVIADDQELTLNYLKNGLVSACLSSCSKPIIGGQAESVGNMDYLLVASPSLVKSFFSSRNLKEGLLEVPGIKFDQNDRLHERYLKTFFQLDEKDLKTHVIPSVQGFKRFALLGCGYALIPRIDIVEELKNKQLIVLSEKVWKLPMYWHSWAVESTFYRKFNHEIVKYLTRTFKQASK